MKCKPNGYCIQIAKAVMTIMIAGTTIALASNSIHATPYYALLAQDTINKYQPATYSQVSNPVLYVRTVSN